MKKIILTILAAVIFGILGLVGYAATRPAEYRVVRSLTMQADPNTVFELVNDFAIWPQWSPWAKMDPSMKNEISNPSSGVGAKNSWVGKEAGVGEQTITASAQGQLVNIDLNFKEPFPSRAKVDFSFAKDGNGTKVTWGMDGKNEDIMSKVFGVVMNMDQMLGSDFEKGLAGLKVIAEETQVKLNVAKTAPADVVPTEALVAPAPNP